MDKTALRLQCHGPDPQDDETTVNLANTETVSVNAASLWRPDRWGQ